MVTFAIYFFCLIIVVIIIIVIDQCLLISVYKTAVYTLVNGDVAHQK